MVDSFVLARSYVSIAKLPISRDGVWPVAVSSIPGPKYLPADSAAAGGHDSRGNGVAFPKEPRFTRNTTRLVVLAQHKALNLFASLNVLHMVVEPAWNPDS